jgi:alkylglycerol monooxygenase
MDYITMAVPVFFVLIGVELLVAWLQGKQRYRLNDSINDLSMGVLSRVGGAFFKTIVFAGYLYIYQHWKLIDMGATSLYSVAGFSAWVWISCFVLKDLMYYWAHRMSHQMNIGWATHIAHHQSEEYNLAVALRQGVFQGLFFWVFYLPLALIGFPPGVYFVCSQFVTLYQFWIHTRCIGKLGPLEWVMNTPSHHRVHHGRDPKYIDKNHAGTFIIWDRMFGTFQVEEEEPTYGIVTPLKSWNPVWGQVHYFVKLAKLTVAAPYWKDKLLLWFKEPAWEPRGLEAPPGFVSESRRPGYRNYDTSIPRGLAVYAFMHFVIALWLATAWLEAIGEMAWPQFAGSGTFITFYLVCMGGIFELKRWALYAECARLIGILAIFLYDGGSFIGVGIGSGFAVRMLVFCLALVSAFWFFRYRHNFGPRSVDTINESAGLAPAKQEPVES